MSQKTATQLGMESTRERMQELVNDIDVNDTQGVQSIARRLQEEVSHLHSLSALQSVLHEGNSYA